MITVEEAKRLLEGERSSRFTSPNGHEAYMNRVYEILRTAGGDNESKKAIDYVDYTLRTRGEMGSFLNFMHKHVLLIHTPFDRRSFSYNGVLSTQYPIHEVRKLVHRTYLLNRLTEQYPLAYFDLVISPLIWTLGNVWIVDPLGRLVDAQGVHPESGFKFLGVFYSHTPSYYEKRSRSPLSLRLSYAPTSRTPEQVENGDLLRYQLSCHIDWSDALVPPIVEVEEFDDNTASVGLEYNEWDRRAVRCFFLDRSWDIQNPLARKLGLVVPDSSPKK